MGPFPLTAPLAHDALARVQLYRGNLELAEQSARAACHILESLPAFAPSVLATLTHILIAANRCAEAIQVAERGLALLTQFGCLGMSEVELRLSISEAYAAAGNHDQARIELRDTLRQIQIRADDIADPFWKNSYLTRNPYCARALLLAREWGMDSAAT